MPAIVQHIAVKPIVFGTIAARLARVPAVVNTFAGLGYAFDEARSRTLLGRSAGIAVRAVLRGGSMAVLFQNAENRDLSVNDDRQGGLLDPRLREKMGKRTRERGMLRIIDRGESL